MSDSASGGPLRSFIAKQEVSCRVGHNMTLLAGGLTSQLHFSFELLIRTLEVFRMWPVRDKKFL